LLASLDLLLNLFKLIQQELLFLFGLHWLKELCQVGRWILRFFRDFRFLCGLTRLFLTCSIFGLFDIKLSHIILVNIIGSHLYIGFNSLSLVRSGRISSLNFGLFLKSFFLFLSNLFLFKLLLLNLRPLLLLDFGVLILKLLLLFLDLVDLVHHNLEPLIEQRIQLRIILEIKLDQGTLCGVPSLAGIGFFLIFLEKISHLALNGLFAAIWETLIEVIDNFLLALK